MPSASLKTAFRALGSRNYRLFFTGQSISLVGAWRTPVATSWLVYPLTKSSMLLGVAYFAGQVSSPLSCALAGVWVDRLNGHKTLLATQILSIVKSFCLAALALSGVTSSEVVMLSFLDGLINAFDTTARQSFVIQGHSLCFSTAPCPRCDSTYLLAAWHPI